MIKLVAFDAFGTLFRFKQTPGSVYLQASIQAGLRLTNNAKADEMQKSLVDSIRQQTRLNPNYGSKSSMPTRAWWHAVVTDTFKPFLDERQVDSEILRKVFENLYAHYSSAEAFECFDDTKAVLDFLTNERKLTLAVISNSDERLHGILKQLDIHDYFSMVFDSKTAGYQKPDPLFFKWTLERMNEGRAGHQLMQPSECLYVGDDAERDFLAPKAAGWNATLVHRRDAADKDALMKVLSQWKAQNDETQLNSR